MDGKTFRGRHFVDLADFSAEELQQLLEYARQLKADHKAGVAPRPLAGKTLAMIFKKPSNRTRVSFEVGMYQLGGHALFIGPDEIQLGTRETVGDVAQVLSRFVDGIMIRTFAHEEVVELAKYASVPVINGLDDAFHPCQAMADFLTVAERFGGIGSLKGLRLAYVGDGNNVLHSVAQLSARCGVDLVAAVPAGFEPDQSIWQAAAVEAQKQGCHLTVTHDPRAAVQGSQVIYTDVWISMGQEAERQRRLDLFQGFRVDEALVAAAGDDTVVMHCLPAHYGEEITDAVAHGPRSIIFDQAENRLHAQKAVLAALMG
jgi:ornithine carbamoyltransferase